MIRDAKYKKGDIIYRQDEEASEVFFVKYGTVHLYIDYKTDESKLISIVPEGKVFGELGVIEGKPRTMTSVAAEETIVTIVDKESFPSYIEEYPNKLLVVMESLSSRIRAQSHKLAKACKVVADYTEEKETKGSVDKALMEEMKILAAENRKAKR
ncbi:MAG: Crp/Fnr family transcriptional regulator [Candidatus Ornithospirochaeta sp.]